MPELDKAYNHQDTEEEIYKLWQQSGFFNPDNLPAKNNDRPFCIVLPPPNVTGTLHLGHSEMLAIEDLMIRYHRMQGYDTLWLPGTDHAAIATQNVVEKKLLKEQKKTRHDLGREPFLREVERFVEEAKNTIKTQLKKMGSSLDWSREAYTLDKVREKAVKTVFINMYNDGLIYRGIRIVNWCPRCHSTLADDEVEYQEKKTPFYYFKYGPVVIGTARPETKFGDKVVIVHPDDKRYQDLIGKEFAVEWILGPIKAKVIADEIADMEMGSGAMTITPAHSFVDFDLAQKYDLEVEQVIDENGKLTDIAGAMAGLPVEEARKKVVEILDKKGLIEKIDHNYIHNLSVCYRCGTPVEPLPSKQWFIDINKKVTLKDNKLFQDKSLKEVALQVVQDGSIKIIPEHFNKTYVHWLENLRPWCISRQIWFGHRIPVWYQGDKIKASLEKPAGAGWRQDEDTLDTWFSSGIWTFSTLGYPDSFKNGQKTGDLARFHPTTVLETGADILFFWVARMILMTTYNLGEIPFKYVYLHGLIRDRKGQKMSKSRPETCIDPLEMIQEFGADALRLSMVVGNSPGNDFRLYQEKIKGYRNFVNKLWNISRFILMNVAEPNNDAKEPNAKTLADHWILEELEILKHQITSYIDDFKHSLAAEELRDFTWAKLADWYIEISKVAKDKDDILLHILTTILKLWHPFAPFVTEQIWQQMGKKDLLMVQAWPEHKKDVKPKYTPEFSLIIDIIKGIRNLRSENKIPANEKLKAIISDDKKLELIEENKAIIEKLARLEELRIDQSAKKPAGWLEFAHEVKVYLERK